LVLVGCIEMLGGNMGHCSSVLWELLWNGPVFLAISLKNFYAAEVSWCSALSRLSA